SARSHGRSSRPVCIEPMSTRLRSRPPGTSRGERRWGYAVGELDPVPAVDDVVLTTWMLSVGHRSRLRREGETWASVGASPGAYWTSKASAARSPAQRVIG